MHMRVLSLLLSLWCLFGTIVRAQEEVEEKEFTVGLYPFNTPLEMQMKGIGDDDLACSCLFPFPSDRFLGSYCMIPRRFTLRSPAVDEDDDEKEEKEDGEALVQRRSNNKIRISTSPVVEASDKSGSPSSSTSSSTSSSSSSLSLSSLLKTNTTANTNTDANSIFDTCDMILEGVGCEGKAVTLLCPGGTGIYIRSAIYGRTDKETCPSSSDSNTACALHVDNYVATRCSGLERCTVHVNNDAFTDPCYGTAKYLRVNYQCLHYHKQVSCQDETAVLKCNDDDNSNPNAQMTILHATYGRSDPNTCSQDNQSDQDASQYEQTDCVDQDNAALNRVAARCDGKNNCLVQVKNDQLGGDPCPGTTKYLTIGYTCDVVNCNNNNNNNDDDDDQSGSMSKNSDDAPTHFDQPLQRDIAHLMNADLGNDIDEGDTGQKYVFQGNVGLESVWDYQHAKSFLGLVADLKMVNVEATHFSCSDGRLLPHHLADAERGQSLRILGGDISEFIYALTVYKDLGAKLNRFGLERLLYEWIDTNPFRHNRLQFYLHTDIDAVKKLMRAIGQDPNTDALLDLTNPPLDLEKTILDALIDAEHQGCVHLRLMLTDPGSYEVDTDVLHWTIQGYYKLLWNKRAIDPISKRPIYQRLRHIMEVESHQETAWINVKMTDECERERIAGIPQTHDDTHAFIAHGQAVEILRRQYATFLKTTPSASELLEKEEEIYEKIAAKAQKAHDKTKDHLVDSMSLEEFDLLIE